MDRPPPSRIVSRGRRRAENAKGALALGAAILFTAGVALAKSSHPAQSASSTPASSDTSSSGEQVVPDSQQSYDYGQGDVAPAPPDQVPDTGTRSS